MEARPQKRSSCNHRSGLFHKAFHFNHGLAFRHGAHLDKLCAPHGLARQCSAATDPKMLNGIWAVFCILPAIARGLYGLSFFLYPIHGNLRNQMIAELADIRADRLAEQEAARKEKLGGEE